MDPGVSCTVIAMTRPTVKRLFWQNKEFLPVSMSTMWVEGSLGYTGLKKGRRRDSENEMGYTVLKAGRSG